MPTYYVSWELLAAALRTELPDDMTFEAIPFPFDALVFMLPKGTVRHRPNGRLRSRPCAKPSIYGSTWTVPTVASRRPRRRHLTICVR